MRRHLMTTTAAMLLAMTGSAFAGMEEAKQFLDKEIGDMSSLSRAEQEKELQWFVDAAKPFSGMEIKVVSESLTTHEYESKVLAPALPPLPASRSRMTSSRKVTSSKNPDPDADRPEPL